MTREEFCKTIDHAILWQNNSRAVVEKRCREVVKYGFACICCNPCEVKFARSIIGGAAHVCAVVGYPMGANTTETKIFEGLNAIENGADELDVVMNISRFRDGDYDYVLNELTEFVKAVKAKLSTCTVKVIIEVAHLTNPKLLVKACELVIASGADYVKQATGYATGNFGYTPEVINAGINNGTENVRAIHEIVGNRIKIKNAGNPRDLDEAIYYIKELGVSRIGHNHMPEWLDAAGDHYWDDK